MSSGFPQDPFATPSDSGPHHETQQPRAQSLASRPSSIRHEIEGVRRRAHATEEMNEKSGTQGLQTATPNAKPWLENKTRKRANKKTSALFLGLAALGIVATAVMLVFTYINTHKQVDQKYCLVLEDDFTGDTLNKDVWFHEQQTGAWGTGEFEWTTDSTNNSFVKDGSLYIVPTLTSDAIGEAAITNGYSLNLTEGGQCTSANKSDVYCAVRSNISTGVIIPPVQSARINTKVSGKAIRYGKVEVTARMPTGDWIWPAIWMMPVNNTYGPWPASGEIDIFEGKGNPARARNDGLSARGHSTLHYGPLPAFDQYKSATSYLDLLQNFWNKKMHKIGLQWTRERIVTYYKTRATQIFDFPFPSDETLWDKSNFPTSLANGTALSNPWTYGDNATDVHAAPFDQDFYLILSVAVGSTNGWFTAQDSPYGLPWSDQSDTAPRDFWAARDKWYPTWPKNIEDRAMVIDNVKIWQQC